jgi:hypothetical protein
MSLLLQDDDQEADIEASIFEQYLSVCDAGAVDPERSVMAVHQ